MIGQNTAHTFAWSEADSLMPISWQCSARASWVLKAGWAPFAYGSSVLFRWEDSCHRCCKSLSSCRRTTQKLFSCKELPWEDPRVYANMVSRYTHTGFDYQSLSHFLLCHTYNSFRMHSKRDPIPRSCGTQRRLRQRHNVRKYIIGLVPSTIVHVFKKILMASCLIYLKNKRRRSSAISGHEPSHTALRWRNGRAWDPDGVPRRITSLCWSQGKGKNQIACHNWYY